MYLFLEGSGDPSTTCVSRCVCSNRVALHVVLFALQCLVLCLCAGYKRAQRSGLGI